MSHFYYETQKDSTYYVEYWTISDQHTGYRVMRRYERGEKASVQGFVGNIYEPGSFDQAKRAAIQLADSLNSQKS